MKLSAKELIEMLDDACAFRFHLDRAKALENVANETNAERKHALMLKIAKDACMWTPVDARNEELVPLYKLARAAIIAEAVARTEKFRKKWGIEISTLELSEAP